MTGSFSSSATISTGGGGGDGSPNNGSIASSASLYLYTFLATLVLLLSVSGAIILRSFILRRRHRLLVEEAIRNGTWIPPSPEERGTGSSRNRVDISKKPVMWDAYVGEKDRELGLGSSISRERGGEKQHDGQTEWDWDSIRPFSAAYLAPPPGAPSKPLRLPSSDNTPNQVYPPRLSYARRFMRFIRPDDPSSQPFPLNQRRLSTVNLDASEGVDWAGHPKKLRVAVLIAMPRPPSERNSSASSASSQHSISIQREPHNDDEDEDKEIPLVEFGIAELDVKGLVPDVDMDADGPRKSESGSAATADV